MRKTGPGAYSILYNDVAQHIHMWGAAGALCVPTEKVTTPPARLSTTNKSILIANDSAHRVSASRCLLVFDHTDILSLIHI